MEGGYCDIQTSAKTLCLKLNKKKKDDIKFVKQLLYDNTANILLNCDILV